MNVILNGEEFEFRLMGPKEDPQILNCINVDDNRDATDEEIDQIYAKFLHLFDEAISEQLQGDADALYDRWREEQP